MKNNLPRGWVECELGDLVYYKKGKKPKKLYSENDNGLLPYVDIKCFEKNVIENYAQVDDGILIDKSSILVVWDGARAGLCGSFKDQGILGSTIMCLTPVCADAELLQYFITSKFQLLNKKTKGTGIPHIKPDLFWKLKINLPPLNEQKRIVEKIESEFEKIDKGIDHLTKVQGQIK